MANKSLFRSIAGALLPKTDAVNDEGAKAYAFTPKHALAQYACTGCLNNTFYADAEAQLAKVVALTAEVEPEFVAKAAIYAREKGFMKDMPALLLASLSTRDLDAMGRAFDRVVDNGKMLRNFVQVMRSGQAGRKSLGSRPKKLIQKWLEARGDESLFKDAVGQSPSMADVVKMVHPKPSTASRAALYAWLIGKPHDASALPQLVRDFEAYKRGESKQVPAVPFQMLTALELGREQWVEIARNGSWQMTRMNLNTFARHGVFEERGLSKLIAKRLSDEQEIRRAKAFPYQLMAAFRSTGAEVPADVRESLQDAMEIAIGNVPAIDGKVYICPDVSGSMRSPATGYRKGATTAVRCIDVAALFAAAILRKNPSAEVLPFEHRVVELRLNGRDSVMTNAEKLASIGGGGTSCSAPLALLNEKRAKGDLVVFVSDNESWVDAQAGRGTATMQEWSRFRERNPNAKLVCIDIQPYGTTQAQERADVLNVGGFSDQVFEIVAAFANGTLAADHWVGEIEKVAV